jgi:hypothetical protein
VRHEVDLIARHCPKCEVAIMGDGVPVSAKIRHYNAVRLGKVIGDDMPHHVCLWISVQQKKRWAIATNPRVDCRIGDGNIDFFKARKHIHSFF